ncbi:MAG TPA: glycosyltransferase [Candidatus Obscuribacterales bacterium]|jgi:glycosyltransferase involved in cell wall biosynthesis
MRLLFVQYAGDYREAFQRFAAGGGETYYAQKYSVDAVTDIAKQVEEVTVLCCMTKEPYNEVLENGVRAIGAGFDKDIQINTLLKLIEEQKPTHLIVRTAKREIFRWAVSKKVRTMALFAESISQRGLRSKLRNYLLADLLNNKQVEWVAAYGLNSAVLFQQIGVKADKIIPWDFIVTETPDSSPPKSLQRYQKDWQLFYIGSMIEAKGVGDVLEALAKLRAKNFPVSLKIAGRDENEYFLNKARQLKIEDCVDFLGLVPNNTVLPLMKEADVVLVPSRHEYPEGFPLAITHSLCARTPIIASDHPMFLDNLKDGLSAMIFPAGNAGALSECIEKLLSNPELYWSLSVESKEAWERLQIPVKWAELINRWIDDSPENKQWLFEHRLSSGQYNLTSA